MTPRSQTFAQEGYDLLLRFPVSPITPGTILAHARRPDTRSRLLAALEALDNDDIDTWRVRFLRAGLTLCGGSWDYVDNVAIGHTFAELASPTRMLEIGVRRGFLTGAVVAAAPYIELHLVDMWEGLYCGRPNPGEPLIKKQLAAAGHAGDVHFYHGDSHTILPTLFSRTPDLQFDLIVVDGDHTRVGAKRDLEAVLPQLAPGGILIFDDVAHPSFPYLLDLWRRCVARYHRGVRAAEYLDHGHGVAFAIRSYPQHLMPDATRSSHTPPLLSFLSRLPARWRTKV